MNYAARKTAGSNLNAEVTNKETGNENPEVGEQTPDAECCPSSLFFCFSPDNSTAHLT